MSLPNTIQPGFPSRLEARRLDEQLTAAEKKLKQYEDLIANLYYNACEDCKETFQRIAGVSSPVAGVTVVSSAPVHSPHAYAKRGWNLLRQISLPWFSTTRSNAPEFVPGPSHVSQEQTPTSSRQLDPTRSPGTSLPNDSPNQCNWLVKYGHAVKPTFQVKLEHVWIPGAAVGSVKFSPDGNYLAAGLGYGGPKTYIYDVKMKDKICVVADRYTRERQIKLCVLSFSPDARYLAISQMGQIMIWEIGKKHFRNALRVHLDPTIIFTCIDFSPDGRFLVGGSQRACVRIWRLHDGSSFVLVDNPYYTASTVKFSPDGKYVATCGPDSGIVFLWNVRTRKLVRKWEAHDGDVWALAFTPDGRRLVTGSGDKTLKYWDITLKSSDRGRLILEFTGHTSDVSSVAISPDGRWIASGSYDRTSRFGDISDTSTQCTLLGHEGWVQSVDFSPEGNHLACGSWDGRVSLWKYESSRD